MPVGREFTSPTKDEVFFKGMTPEEMVDVEYEPIASSSDVAPEQEATPAQSSVVKDYWVDRPDVVIRVHKIPRQTLYIPICD